MGLLYMVEKQKDKIRGLTFQNKIFFLFLFFAIVLMGATGLGLDYMYAIYSKELYDKSLQNLNYYVLDVNDSIAGYDALTKEMILDDNIQECLSEMSELDTNSQEYKLCVNKLRNLLYYEIITYDYIKSFVFLNEDELILQLRSSGTDIPTDIYSACLELCHEAKGGYVSINPSEDYNYLVCSRDVLELKDVSLDYLGTIVFSVDLTAMIASQTAETESNGMSLAVYADEQVVFQHEEMLDLSEITLEGTSGYKIVKQNGERYFVCYQKDTETELTYVNAALYSKAYARLGMIRNLMILFYAGVVCILLFVTRRTVVILFHPVKKLVASMKKAESGEFKEARIMLDTKYPSDEIGMVIDEFKSMLEQLEQLIYENYEKQILIKDTNYKMLLSQINAHFIYNTLNTISLMVRLGKNAEAAQMIVSLGDLLRASLSKDPMASIEEEANTAMQYMKIQKYRYQDKIDFRLEVDENLKEFMIPRLVLQPIIENAVLYGVETVEEQILIHCKVWEETDSIKISIQDSGPGMSESVLSQLRDGTIVPKGHGIGIANIRERLAMTFEKVVFEINSVLGEGTTVLIQIGK